MSFPLIKMILKVFLKYFSYIVISSIDFLEGWNIIGRVSATGPLHICKRNYSNPGLLATIMTIKIVFLVFIKKKKKKKIPDFPGGPVVSNSPANAGDKVRALVWEDSTCRWASGPVYHYS